MDNDFVIRKARISDVKAMHAMLLDNPEEEGLVLPRSFNQLYTLLRDFFVVVEKESGRLAGCCALSICWEELAEVRSLVIHRDFRGRGLGRDMVEACLSEAVTLGLYKVFVLSNTPDFFAHLGFREVPKDVLPQKVWSDCLNCPKFPDCDETAMMMRL